MKEPIFKPGDRIYHPFYGWAKVSTNENNIYRIIDEADNHLHTPDRDYMEKMYSFVEYDLVSGGFSQERPGFKRGETALSGGLYVLVTGVDEGKTEYETFSGVVIKGGGVACPPGYYSKTWDKSAFSITDLKVGILF